MEYADKNSIILDFNEDDKSILSSIKVKSHKIVKLLENYTKKHNIILKVRKYRSQSPSKFLFFNRNTQKYYYELTTSKEI